MLTVQRLSGADGFATLRSEWAALDQSLSPRTPFTAPLWHELWWRHFQKKSLLARDEFLMLALRDCAGQLVAVAPMMRTSRPSFGPIRLCEVQFFGADPNMTELRGPICRPTDQAEVVRTLMGYFGTVDRLWHWIRWQGIRRDLPDVHGVLEGSGRFRWTRTVPDYVIKLPSEWSAFEQGQSRRVRKKLRSCYKLLANDRHVIDFRVKRLLQDAPSAVDTFLDLHKTRTQVRYFDVFASPKARAFLNEYASAMAARDQLRIFQIAFDGTVVASRLGLAFGKELYLYHAGNDPAWDKYSIMTTLLAEIMKWAIGENVELLNLSTGDDRSKTRWKPIEIVYDDGIQVAPGFAGERLSRGYEFLRAQRNPGSSLRKVISSIWSGPRSPEHQSEAPSLTGEGD
jgi:CelD/BcsL family acetyltransferase involved in cellulose biosynthesis